MTGAGKTYILASFIKNFIENGYIKKMDCISPFPILWVTKASIVEQTRNVLRDEFGIDISRHVKVINIEYLRSEVGKIFVREDLKIVNGEELVEFEWLPYIHPALIIWDECQGLVREQAIQSKIAMAYSDITTKPTFQINASASPMARVCEGKQFALATKKTLNIHDSEYKVTKKNWSTIAKLIANPSDPEEYVEAAVDRYVDLFESNIVRIKGIQPKHRAKNSVLQIDFETDEERMEYIKAWDEFQEAKAKIEGRENAGEGGGHMEILARFTIFRRKAEYIRRHYIARWVNDMWNRGFAPIAACSFKATITSVTTLLIQDYNWSRDDISLIWGGSTEALSNKAKISKKMKEAGVEELLRAQGISLADLGLSEDQVDMKIKSEAQLEFEKKHNLLSQKPQEREKERLRFQRQDSRALLFTFKAGGVGLSAHHESKYPNAKPRRTLLTPVYSEKELIQALGRGPRITSASDTYQVMCFYKNTIEGHVAERVTMKLKCMKQVVRARESWEDLIIGSANMDKDIYDDGEEVSNDEGALLQEYADDISEAMMVRG
jgi:hypothetical protein